MNYTKQKRNRPRLDRRNAVKNIDYVASNSPSSESSSFEDSSSSSSHRLLRSLDHFSDVTSFRVEGIEGEFDLICRSLGLSGHEDFSIPIAAWKASKASSPSARLRSSRFRDNFADGNLVENDQLSDSFAILLNYLELRLVLFVGVSHCRECGYMREFYFATRNWDFGGVIEIVLLVT